MNTNAIPISTLFIGLNGLIAFVLSYIAPMERTRTRVWHDESKEDDGESDRTRHPLLTPPHPENPPDRRFLSQKDDFFY